MNQDSQDFEPLRRLLALKRYEQPPPGYFNRFSREVIVRIKAGEGAHESVLQRLFWEAPWLQRLWAALETKPVMAGTFGAAVCAIFVAGAIYSGTPDGLPGVSGPLTQDATPVTYANNGAGSDQSALAPSSSFPSQGASAESITLGNSAEGIFRLVPKPFATPATFKLDGSH